MTRQRIRSVMLRGALGAVALVLVGVLGIGALRAYERLVTFHPERIEAGEAIAPPEGGIEVWFPTDAGVRLHGWYFQTPGRPAPATILYLHGNGGNIRHVGWLGAKLRGMGFDALVFDYQGYGRSEGRMTEERDVYASAEAAWRFLVETHGARADRVVFYGQSLGTTAAVELATHRPCAALILESGLSSASSLAAHMAPWIPASLHRFARNRFESARKLRGIRCPVLVSHGDPDSVIPTEEGRKLFAAANEPRELALFPGVDHNVFGRAGDAYFARLAAFLQRALAAPQTVSP